MSLPSLPLLRVLTCRPLSHTRSMSAKGVGYRQRDHMHVGCCPFQAETKRRMVTVQTSSNLPPKVCMVLKRIMYPKTSKEPREYSHTKHGITPRLIIFAVNGGGSGRGYCTKSRSFAAKFSETYKRNKDVRDFARLMRINRQSETWRCDHSWQQESTEPPVSLPTAGLLSSLLHTSRKPSHAPFFVVVIITMYMRV